MNNFLIPYAGGMLAGALLFSGIFLPALFRYKKKLDVIEGPPTPSTLATVNCNYETRTMTLIIHEYFRTDFDVLAVSTPGDRKIKKIAPFKS